MSTEAEAAGGGGVKAETGASAKTETAGAVSAEKRPKSGPVATGSTYAPPLRPGSAVPRVEFGGPRRAVHDRRGGGSAAAPRSERTVQTLTPPARR